VEEGWGIMRAGSSTELATHVSEAAERRSGLRAQSSSAGLGPESADGRGVLQHTACVKGLSESGPGGQPIMPLQRMDGMQFSKSHAD
jgi:hypothetical protein